MKNYRLFIIYLQAGANIIVSGTGIYDHKDMKYAIDHMKNSVQKEIKL